MSDKRITGDHAAPRRAGAPRPEALPSDARLDRLVTALAEARPVLDDLTRARVGAKLVAATRKWSVGSAVRAEPDAGAASVGGGQPDAPLPQPIPRPPVIARPQAPPPKRPAHRHALLVLVLVLAGIIAIALRA